MDEKAKADSPPSEDLQSELQVLNGGVEITIVKVDGSQEQVKVRQLPIRLIPDWGQLQGNEAVLCELLCNKIDTGAIWKLRNERASEERLLAFLNGATLDQTTAIEKRLAETRARIEKLEAAEHWSDSLAEESIVKIIEQGERLNRPRFGRWTNRSKESIGRTMKQATDALDSAKSSLPSPSS